MAERLNHISDVPDFDRTRGLKVAAGPENPTPLQDKDKARRVGTAVGKAVVTIRDAGETLRDIAGETREVAAIGISDAKNKAREATRRISNMAETVKGKTGELVRAAGFRASQLGQVAAAKAADMRSDVRMGYYRARLKTNQAVREYPVHVVLAAGAIGFLCGVGLRIWRSKP